MRVVGVFLLGLFLMTSLVAAQEAEDQQYLQMRRTACVILSRMHSNTEKAVIEEVIQGFEPNDQQRYINKLYAEAVEKCEAEITQQEVQSVPHPSFSSTSSPTNSTPPPCSPSSTASTTARSARTSLPPKSKMPSPASSRSSTRRTRSERKNERPRRSKRRASMSVTR